jgi:putative endonuclease
MREHHYYVYMLTNSSKKVIYTGVTNNLCQRITEHYLNRGTPGSFAGKYYCYWLVYFETHKYVNDAIAREKELKNLIRAEKDKLVNSFNPNWVFLNKQVCDGWPPPTDSESR